MKKRYALVVLSLTLTTTTAMVQSTIATGTSNDASNSENSESEDISPSTNTSLNILVPEETTEIQSTQSTSESNADSNVEVAQEANIEPSSENVVNNVAPVIPSEKEITENKINNIPTSEEVTTQNTNDESSEKNTVEENKSSEEETIVGTDKNDSNPTDTTTSVETTKNDSKTTDTNTSVETTKDSTETTVETIDNNSANLNSAVENINTSNNSKDELSNSSTNSSSNIDTQNAENSSSNNIATYSNPTTSKKYVDSEGNTLSEDEANKIQDLLDSIKKTEGFVVYADELDETNHIEGNIAVNKATHSGSTNIVITRVNEKQEDDYSYVGESNNGIQLSDGGTITVGSDIDVKKQANQTIINGGYSNNITVNQLSAEETKAAEKVINDNLDKISEAGQKAKSKIDSAFYDSSANAFESVGKMLENDVVTKGDVVSINVDCTQIIDNPGAFGNLINQNNGTRVVVNVIITDESVTDITILKGFTAGTTVKTEFNEYASYVVWNFGDYNGPINFKEEMLGIIVAPKAHVYQEAGNLNGQFIAKIAGNNGELHQVTLVDDSTPTPTPGEEEKPTPAPTPGEEEKPTPTPTPGEEEKPTPTPTPGKEEKLTPTPTPGEEEKTTPTPTPGEEEKPTPTPTPGEEEKPTPTPTPGEEEKPTPTPTNGEEEKPSPIPTEPSSSPEDEIIEKDDTVKTGDVTNTAPLISTFLASIAGIFGIVIFKRKK